MAQTINTNVASLNAQRQLNSSQGSLATSLQRLSSGLRINSAKDDAAGLAISERFSTQIRGLNQAVRNANDGISLSQTAEGALVEVGNNLQRIRELAVQSANATNSAEDRAALDREVQQRLAEIQRISSETAFNGQKILDGSFGSAAFQIGANVGQTISVDLGTSMKTADIGKYVSAASDATVTGETATATGGIVTSGAFQTGVAGYTGVSDAAIASGNVAINGVTINDSSNYVVSGDAMRGEDSAYAKAAAINASAVTGVTASANTTKTFDDNAVADGMFLDVSADGSDDDKYAYTLEINGEKIFDAAEISTDGITIDAAISAINSRKFDTGVVASKDESNKLVLTASDGRNIEVQESFGFSDVGASASSASTIESVFSTQTFTDVITTDNSTGASPFAQTKLVFRGEVALQSSSGITINQGNGVIGFSAGSYEAASSLEAQNVLTAENANKAILSIDSALAAVSTLRSDFGAIQNRFESTIASLQTTSENLSASRGRILDADFASETANLTRAQILQQAGTAMLAQANGLPQNVLSLLRG